jgi:Fur family transcriptional regulator, ferric uptake regulator
MERHTRQRAAIREVISHARRPLLPLEVLGAAKQRVPGLGIATVYRNLKALVEDGTLRAVHLPGDNPRFETVGRLAHHHHFQCRACQRVFDAPGCPGNLAELAPSGFTVDDHELTLYGRCNECAASAPAPRAGAEQARPTLAA